MSVLEKTRKYGHRCDINVVQIASDTILGHLVGYQLAKMQTVVGNNNEASGHCGSVSALRRII